MEHYQIWTKALAKQADLTREAEQARLIFQVKQTKAKAETPNLRYFLGLALIRLGERVVGLSASSVGDF